MKKINIKITVILLVTAAIITGCGLNKMVRDYDEGIKYTPQVNPLENHGGTVAVDVNGRVGDKYFHNRAVVEITPVLKYEGGEVPLETVVLRGEKTEVEGIRIARRGATTFDVSGEIDFTEEMLASELVMDVSLYREGREDQAETLPERKVADGVINTSQRVDKDERLSLAPHGYEKEVIVTRSANIYFDYMRHNLNWRFDLNRKEENKEKMEELNKFLKKGWEIKSVELNAWASPEGEIAFNEELSENRASTGHRYWKGQFEKLEKELEDYEKPEIKVSARGEDFEGFMTKLEASEIEQKETIANVINSELAPAEREKRIKDMTVIYEEIEKILMPLRRAEIVINAYEPKKTDEEIATLSTTNPEELDEKELLYAATLTEDLDTKLQIYNAAKELFPQNYRGFNNAAYVNLKLGNAEEAAKDLEIANELAPNTGFVLNNLGVVAAWEEDYENARSYYEAAEGQGINTKYNVGNIMIIIGDYEAALSSYAGYTCTHNVALAHLLNNNEQAAMTNLECADEAASVAYLTAIIGARREDTAMLYENLRKAISLDPEYKECARIDREFINYFDAADFQEIVN